MQFEAFALTLATLALIKSGSADETKKLDGIPASFYASIRFMGHHRCSGAVIGETSVVTAAQCVQGKKIDYMEVAVGPSMSVLHQVSDFEAHPLHDSVLHVCDLAVLKVKSPFTVAESVEPIALATSHLNTTASGPSAVTAEWNKTENQLLVQEVHLMDIVHCKTTFGANSRMICITPAQLVGDIGAPLVYEGQLHGILTKTAGADGGREVGIYTRVFPHAKPFLVDGMAVRSVMDEVCKALKVIIETLRDIPFIPSFVRKAVENLANYLHC